MIKILVISNQADIDISPIVKQAVTLLAFTDCALGLALQTQA
jgi:hypothetical protein